MESITRCKDKKWDHIVPCAQYHLGRAYYEGFGVQQSDAEAENLWILAARDGNRDGSIKAQTMLGMFYSRPGEETYDIRKVRFSAIKASVGHFFSNCSKRDKVEFLPDV